MGFNYEEALVNLTSTTARERFEATKFFMKNKFPEVKTSLIEQKKVEKVMHIKKALDKALSNQEEAEVIDSDESFLDSILEDPKGIKKHLKAQAIDEFSGIILHELEPKIGILKVLLATEIDKYEESSSKKCMEEFEQFFKALENLRKSSTISSSDEIDIPQIIKDIVSTEINTDINITYEGMQPCIAISDKNLLSLAISNGIRNAKESLLELSDESEKKMMISWDRTDIDCWICIADEGVGLKDTPEAAFLLGTTSKDNHSGFGLGIINQAMETIGGDAELLNNDVGAKLILRWSNFE